MTNMRSLKLLFKKPLAVIPALLSATVVLFSSPGSAASGIITQLGEDINGEVAQEAAGLSVSISGDGTIVAFGSPFLDDSGKSQVGEVNIYKWDGSSWSQLGSPITGTVENSQMGRSISLSSDGTAVALGSPARAEDNNALSRGSTRIYKWDGGAWAPRGPAIIGEANNDHSGSAVSLNSDGTRVAIGADSNGGSGSRSGHTRIYEWNGTDAWVQMGSDIDGEAAGDLSGTSVSMSLDGNRVAIGAYNNDGGGTSSGHTRIYEWNGTDTWVQMGSDIDGENEFYSSGWSVSLNSDGTHVAIGAPNNSKVGSDSGQTRIYRWNGTAWIQVGDDIDGKAAGEFSGGSVSLNSDGTRVAIGPDGAIASTEPGYTRVYEFNGTVWEQIGLDIDGKAPGDDSGISVSLDADGTVVAIGASNHNPGGAFGAGQVRVFTFACTP